MLLCFLLKISKCADFALKWTSFARTTEDFPFKQPEVKFEILNEDAYKKYSEINNKLNEYLKGNFARYGGQISHELSAFIASFFKAEKVAIEEERRIINFKSYLLNNEIKSIKCYCNFFKAEHPKLVKFLRIFELLRYSKIFNEIVSRSKLTKDKNSLFTMYVVFGLILQNNQINDNFPQDLNCFFRSILLDFLKIFDGKTRENELINLGTFRSAIFEFLEPITESELSITYKNDSFHPQKENIFRITPDAIYLGSFLSIKNDKTQYYEQSKIIIKYVKNTTERDRFKFKKHYKLDRKDYYLLSFAFGNIFNSQSTADKTISHIFHPNKKFYKCDSNLMTKEELKIGQKTTESILMCLEETSGPKKKNIFRKCLDRTRKIFGLQ